MKGFFRSEETQAGACGVLCKLGRACRKPNRPASGDGRKGILILTDAASDAGTPSALVQQLRGLGINMERDCWYGSVVRCPPPAGRMPSPTEIAACRPHVLEEIKTLKPSVIILTGAAAVESIIGHRWTRDGVGGVSRWRGWAIPDRCYGAWVFAIFNANQLDEERKGSVVPLVWKQDIARALAHVGKKLPPPLKQQVDIGPAAVIDLFNDPGPVAIDFETSGIKPDWPGHYIKSVSIATATRTAACLMSSVTKQFIKFAGSPVAKIGHNIKHEHRWCLVCLETAIERWIWDTMQVSHIQDNRVGHINNLKFQAYVCFGEPGYSDAVDFGDGDSNEFNAIEKIPEPVLLRYNGMDSRITYDLAVEQATAAGTTLEKL